MESLANEQEVEYINQIKQFLLTDAWKKYALPLVYNAVQKELPAPNTPNWEDRYRYAFALTTAFNLVINTLANLSGKDEFLKKVEKFMEEGAVDHGAPVDEA